MFKKRPQTTRRRFLKRTKGTTALEMALILPFLMLLVCGIVDFGNLYLQANMVSEVAREGARIAATAKPPPSQASLQTTLRSEYNNNQLTVTMNPGTPTTGSAVKVTVTEPVTIMTPGISAFFPTNPYTVTGQCNMQTE
jgi:Flp pilus assembly protein TadG